LPNFAAIGYTVTEISRFFDIQDGGRPLSWICCTGDWTTHERRLVVITQYVQPFSAKELKTKLVLKIQ